MSAQHIDESAPIRIDAWSDVACPYCFLAHRQLVAAIPELDHPVEVRHRSYQLMPNLRARPGTKLSELLIAEGRVTRAQADSSAQHLRSLDHDAHLDFENVVAADTHQAHQLIKFADLVGRGHEVLLRLFEANFSEGRDVGDREVLVAIASEVGLSAEEAEAALRQGTFADAVDADIEEARSRGVRGVPFFIIDGRYSVAGVQETATGLAAALRSVLERRTP